MRKVWQAALQCSDLRALTSPQVEHMASQRTRPKLKAARHPDELHLACAGVGVVCRPLLPITPDQKRQEQSSGLQQVVMQYPKLLQAVGIQEVLHKSGAHCVASLER